MGTSRSQHYPHASGRASLGEFLSSWVEQQLLLLPTQALTSDPPCSTSPCPGSSCTSSSSSSSSHCSGLHLAISKLSKKKEFLLVSHSRPLILVYHWGVWQAKQQGHHDGKAQHDHVCALKQPLQFPPGTLKMNPSSPAVRHHRYTWVWEYTHVKVQTVFHVNKHVFPGIWDSILNALMAAQHLKSWKNPAPNWKWCKLQCKEFTLEDWKVVFKTLTCQLLWEKGFYLAHLSGLLVLVWKKRAQSRHKKGVILKMWCFVHLPTHSLVAFGTDVWSLSSMHLGLIQVVPSEIYPGWPLAEYAPLKDVGVSH